MAESETTEFAIKAPKRGPKYGRGPSRTYRTRAEQLFRKHAAPEIKATRQAVSEAFKPKAVPAPVAPKAVKGPSLASKAVSFVWKHKGGVGTQAGRAGSAVASKLPLIGGRLAKPMTGFLGKRLLGPAGAIGDVATTARAAYAGAQAAKAVKELDVHIEAAAKRGVGVKRKSIAQMAGEALTTFDTEKADPGVKVWNPKTKRWE